MTKMKRFLIERGIPGVGGMSIVELCGAARASNQAIAKIGSAIQPKSGSYPVAGNTSGDLNGPKTGAILSLT